MIIKKKEYLLDVAKFVILNFDLIISDIGLGLSTATHFH